MIRSRRTTKNCNICNREVAVLKIFRFHTVYEYVTLRGDERSLLGAGERNDVHICSRCWDMMAERVRRALEK